MDRQYNLLIEPWIPVLRRDGTRSWCGFRDAVAESASIATLDFDDPLAQIAVQRYLEAMVLAAEDAPLGTEDRQEWANWVTDLFELGNLDRTTHYLDERVDSFWLVGGKQPFLQDPTIAAQCSSRSSVNKLIMSRNSGANPLFFSRGGDSDSTPLEFASAAAALAAQACFGAGGRCSSRSGKANSKQGTLRGFTVFALRGGTLFETLLANLVPAFGDAEVAASDGPVWQLGADKSAPGGPLSRRTATTKGLLLHASDGEVVDFTLTWGPDHPIEAWPVDHSAAIRIDVEGSKAMKQRPFKAAQSTAVWVDAVVLVAADAQEAAASPTGRYALKPPMVLSLSHPMARSKSRAVRAVWKQLTVTATTHFADQSKDVASVCVDVGIPLDAQDEESTRRRRLLKAFAKRAVDTAAALGEAVRIAQGDLPRVGAQTSLAPIGVASDATAPFWSEVGDVFRTLAMSSSENDVETALASLSQCARTAFDSSIGALDCTDPRRARLVESARRRLWERTALKPTELASPPVDATPSPQLPRSTHV